MILIVNACIACRLNKCRMSTDLFRAPKQNKSNIKALVKVKVENQPEVVRLLKRKQISSLLIF